MDWVDEVELIVVADSVGLLGFVAACQCSTSRNDQLANGSAGRLLCSSPTVMAKAIVLLKGGNLHKISLCEQSSNGISFRSLGRDDTLLGNNTFNWSDESNFIL